MKKYIGNTFWKLVTFNKELKGLNSVGTFIIRLVECQLLLFFLLHQLQLLHSIIGHLVSLDLQLFESWKSNYHIPQNYMASGMLNILEGTICLTEFFVLEHKHWTLEIIFSVYFLLYPYPKKFSHFFFLTLEKIGIDEKVICYHNISN